MGEAKEIISSCPSCGSRYKVPPGFYGKTLSCKNCGTPFKLVEASQNHTKEPKTEAASDKKVQGIGPEDPCLIVGRLVVKYCYASEEQVREAIAFQVEERQQGRNRTLGEILVARGMISQDQLKCVISVQQLVDARQLDVRFGSMAVQNGFAKEEDILNALEKQKSIFKEQRTVKRIGDILVEAGILTSLQKDGILERQRGLTEFSPPTEQVKADAGPNTSKVFEIRVSEDGLSASLVLENERPVRPDIKDIKAALAAHGICHGLVDDQSIESMLKGEQGKGTFTIAQGMAPVAGGAATIRHLFNTDPLKVGEIKEGGTIDFRERGPVPQVKEGDLLAEKVLPDDGIPGVDVYGKEIPPPVGRDIKLRGGKGTRLSEDGTRLLADVPGRPELRADGKVYVFSDLEIDGDIDLKTGHVDFQGHVVVSGAVQSGFRVKGGSLTSNEVLKAEVETAGDVAVFGGIIGATIRSGGHVRARYIHDSQIEALGDVVVEKEIIDSRIESSGLCSAKKGHILSSQIQAKKGIEAAQIGSDSSRQCHLTVGTNERARNEIEKLKGGIQAKKQERKALEGRVQELEKEALKVQSEIGILAQEQDRALVNKRKLSAKIDELQKAGADDHIPGVKRLIEPLDQEIAEREKVLDSRLEAQEKIGEQISAAQEEPRRLDREIAAIEEEIASIAEWAQADKGSSFVKIYGSVCQYTSIKGIYSSIILPETHSRVLIKEIKVRGSDDRPEWKMKISRL
ncbi:MAG: DUF342 domain-containing protein [Desulfobacteraceae bacterium]|nr:MAG: DUF342 domain-containing protein [Desulfobacteraceae bacterium]